MRCALGEIGRGADPRGRRHVELGPVGALTFFFDVRGAVERALPLARTVRGAPSLDAAREALAALGIRSELDYERDRAAEQS